MKTCTLRKLESGEIVATVDESPKVGDWFYYEETNQIFLLEDNDPWMTTFSKLIASTIPNVGKILKVDNRGKYFAELVGKKKDVEFGEQYEYTENENQIVIKL